jgi:F-type H+-transporting ATPase subunit gamma
MEMIAAAKMRRAQQRMLASRPYATKLIEFLGELGRRHMAGDSQDLHPLLEVREPRNIGVVLVTPDRGFVGGLNANVNRAAVQFALRQTVPVSFVTVGKKGRDFMHRYGRDIRAEFLSIGDFPTPLDTAPISTVVLQDYTQRVVDRVYLIYSDFVSAAVQRPVVRQILPIEPPARPEGQAPEALSDFVFEPDPEAVLGGLLPRYVEMQVYQAVLENAASEQSARMVAMRAATDAAGEMIEGLTLQYNKARQESITKELLDLVGGVAALESA